MLCEAGLRLGGEAAAEAAARLRAALAEVHSLGEHAWWYAEHVLGFRACNWRVEQALEEFLHAVGDGRPPSLAPPAGHDRSVTEERWLRIWSYYFYLRRWLLPQDRLASIPNPLLTLGDPTGEIGEQVHHMLGEPTELKRLYVRRFTLCLEFWLFRLRHGGVTNLVWPYLAEREVEERIVQLRPDDDILRPMLCFCERTIGRLPPCHFLLFWRYDALLESIGAEHWIEHREQEQALCRERGALLRTYLDALESWLSGARRGDEFSARLRDLLGRPDPTKRFWATVALAWYRPAQVIAERGEAFF